MGVGVVLPSPRVPALGDGHPPPLLLQPGENVMGDSGLSEVQTPLSSGGVGGGMREISRNTGLRAAGFHYPGKTAHANFSLCLQCGGRSGHLSQGTIPPNPSRFSCGRERFGIWLCFDTLVRVSGTRPMLRAGANPTAAVPCVAGRTLVQRLGSALH